MIASLLESVTATRRGAGALALVAMTVMALALWPVPVQLAALWTDTDRPFSHGMLVGPIALWLTLRVYRDARSEPPVPSAIALILLAGGTALWIVAFVIDVLILQQTLFPALLVLAAASIAGWATARRLIFPVGFLYFAIPVWTALVPPLQQITVFVVGAVVNGFGIPVFIQENFITIPEGTFEVAGGCAGLHFLIVASTLAGLCAYLTLTTWRARLLLLGAAVALALLTNWVRVGSLVVIGHVSEMQHYLIRHDHYYYGWVLFSVALIPLFLLAHWQAAAEPAAEASFRAAGSTAPWVWRLSHSATAGVFALLLLVPLAVTLPRGVPVTVGGRIELPTAAEGWQAGDGGDWVPVYVGADAEARAGYRYNDDRVDAYVAIYISQSQGRELVGQQNRLYSAGWRLQRSGQAEVEGLPGLQRVREQVAVGPDGGQRVVWFWYVIGDRLVVDDVAAKLWQAVGRFSGADSGAVVAVSAPCAGDCAAARARLQALVRALGPALTLAARGEESAT